MSQETFADVKPVQGSSVSAQVGSSEQFTDVKALKPAKPQQEEFTSVKPIYSPNQSNQESERYALTHPEEGHLPAAAKSSYEVRPVLPSGERVGSMQAREDEKAGTVGEQQAIAKRQAEHPLLTGLVKAPGVMTTAGSNFGKRVGVNLAAEAVDLDKDLDPNAKLTSEAEMHRDYPRLTGAAEGIGGTIGGAVADPTNWLLAATGAEAEPVLQRLLSGAFATKMGIDTAKGVESLKDNWDKLTPEQRAEQVSSLGIGGLLTAVAAEHAEPDFTGENLPSAAKRSAVNLADSTLGTVARTGLKKVLPGAAAPFVEEYAHIPGRNLGLEPSEASLQRMTEKVNVAKERLKSAEAAIYDKQRGPLGLLEGMEEKSVKPSPEEQRAYDKAKQDYTEAVERLQATKEAIPYEKTTTALRKYGEGEEVTIPTDEYNRPIYIERPSEYLKTHAKEGLVTDDAFTNRFGKKVTDEPSTGYKLGSALGSALPSSLRESPSPLSVVGDELPSAPYGTIDFSSTKPNRSGLGSALLDREITPELVESIRKGHNEASGGSPPEEDTGSTSARPSAKPSPFGQAMKPENPLGEVKVSSGEPTANEHLATSKGLGRIEAALPGAENTIQNVEQEAQRFGTSVVSPKKNSLGRIDLSRLEPLLNEATGGKPLAPDVPLREQGLGRIQTPGEEAQKLSSDLRKAVLQKANATPEEIETILQRSGTFAPTSKVGLSKLAEHFGVDLGDSAIGRGKADMAAGTHLPPHEVLQRIIDAGHSPAEIVKAINEGRHLPPVSGGSQGADHAPAFYSKAERVANEKVNTGSGDSILSTLRNNGVKESEIEDLGLEDFLKGKPRVTKADLQQFIAGNKAELRDVELGGEQAEQLKQLSKSRDAAFVENNRIWDDHLRRSPYSTELFNAIRDGDAQEIIDQMPKDVQDHAQMFVATDNLIRNYDAAIDKMSRKIAPTKYSKWTLPGDKSNYTEKLITLPQEPTSILEWKENHRGKWAWFSGKDQVSGAYPEESDRENARESIKIPSGAGQFRSTHWEEPNVLAHVRYDERPSLDGKKTLFLEELQSDWHQQGKQIGYSNPAPTKLPDGVHVVPDNGYFRVVNREGNSLLYRTFGTEAGAREAALEHYGEGAGNKGVPDAPFKNTWHELVMKKMLREAAEKGYDRLAWTTGDQQADRYDLSKHIGSIEYDMDSKTLIARNPEGRKVLDEEIEPDQKELARYIGEEPAKKLMEQIDDHPGPVDEDHLWNMYMDDYRVKEVPDPHDDEGSRYVVHYAGDREPLESFDTETAAHRYIEDQIRFEIENYEKEPNPSLKGLDLKTGGEWARALYDRAIPNFLKSYAKKWGAKVGTTELTTAEPGALRYEIVDPSGHVHDAFRNREGAEDALRGYQESHRGPGTWTVNDTGTKEKVHSIEITPAMKKHVLQEGQPISKVDRPLTSSGGLGRIEFAA